MYSFRFPAAGPLCPVAVRPRSVIALCAGLLAGLLAACGGGGGDAGGSSGLSLDPKVVETAPPADGGSGGLAARELDRPTSGQDASRVLHQATFGPNSAGVAEVARVGVRKYLLQQMDLPVSQYAYAGAEAAFRSNIHTLGLQNFCNQEGVGPRDTCWRDYYSPVPVQWDFYRQAVSRPDQFRQRMAFIWSQIFVTSARQLDGTYGFALYHQMLRDHAFANYRTLLERVALSPLMGAYLNMVDNDAADPNENFAREMLQLFTIGPCALNPDGSLLDGKCYPSYSNEIVRNYAYALTGWTYPDGGRDPWCDARCRAKTWKNPRHYRGAMVPRPQAHDGGARALLSGVVVPAQRTPQQALALVLDSLMAHPNIAPFVGRQLIRFLVTSNPSTAYVQRVAQAFRTGVHNDAAGPIGSGQAGDMVATVMAVLLDPEARDAAQAASADYGRLREPAQLIAGAIRALEGLTDGEPVATEWGFSGQMGQPVFQAPSVFNFYPPDFPLTGSDLVAPQLGIESLNATLARMNFVNALVYWWSVQGSKPGDLPDATGTRVDFGRWEALLTGAGDSDKVIDALDQLLTSGRLGATARTSIRAAMDVWTPSQQWLANQTPPSSWKRERVRTAVFLILTSPHYQVQR